MSIQSERREKALKKARAIAKSVQAQENRANQSAEAKPHPEHRKKEEKIIPSDPRRNLIDRPGIVAAVGACVFALAAFIQLYNHTIAIWLLFLALIAFAQALRVEITDHNKSSLLANFTGAFVCIAGLIFCGMLQKIELSKPPPHFAFFLRTEDDPTNEVWLTNSFFNFKRNGETNPVRAHVWIPVDLTKPPVVGLQFGFKNESSNAADGVTVILTVSKKFDCKPDEKWEKLDSKDASENLFTGNGSIDQQWQYPSSTTLQYISLPPTVPLAFPEIKIQTIPTGLLGFSNSSAIFTLTARTKDSQFEEIAFVLHLAWKTSESDKPFVSDSKDIYLHPNVMRFDETSKLFK